MAKYDYLIVGAGLFGAVFAYEAGKRGKSCLVIDKRPHIAGNIYTEQVEGINVHKYGAHIFHTSDKKIWEYVNQFAEFNNYINSPVASYKDELYNLPFNMNTFSKMWGIKKPSEAKAIIEKQIADLNIGEPKNLEEQALKLAGTDVYEKLVKGYTEKQWGRPCTELPAFIIKRLPLRFIYDNNYFNDRFQGIPMGGYTQIIEKMLEGAEVKTDTDYFDFIKENPDIADKTVYTGMIDEFFGFQYGPLEYRSVRFETEVLDEENYQGNAVVNYTHRDVPYTRIIEHKHFEFGKQPKTVISREYSAEWKPGVEPYYPVNNDKNNALYEKYKELAEFNRFTNSPVANFKGELYSLPFNMYTFNKMWGVVTPEEATAKIEEQRKEIIGEPQNLEEQAISLVGRDIYEKLIKGYTEKQWGRDCKELPSFIIKRLPVRLTFDNNYFNALYQGIPIGGYTKMIANLLDAIEVRLNTDYLENKTELEALADKIVYTGPIDAYFDYKLGTLEYRSVRFETETLDKPNFQGNAAVNYTDRETPWTRIIEHKWFEFGKDENGNDLPKTIISREYSSEWKPGDEPYYPVNDAKNSLLYSEYKKLTETEKNVIFGGRLGEYKYYDMDQVIAAVLDKCEKELGE